jgi:hypothetical protein
LILPNKLTLSNSEGVSIEIPLEEIPPKREYGPNQRPIDVVIEGNPALRCPVLVKILLRSDGSWVHWATEFNGGDNGYLHLVQSPDCEPSEAQRRTVARWWLDLDPTPYRMGLGRTTCEWAFKGMTPQQVSDTYGDGSRPILTARCDEKERIIR